MIRKPSEPIIPVDVQHKTECRADFTRYFATLEEAQKYATHMNHERGYLAQIRYCCSDQPLTGRELNIAVNNLLKNI